MKEEGAVDALLHFSAAVKSMMGIEEAGFGISAQPRHFTHIARLCKHIFGQFDSFSVLIGHELTACSSNVDLHLL